MIGKHQTDSLPLSEGKTCRIQPSVYAALLIACLAWILSGCSNSADASNVSAVEAAQNNATIQSMEVKPLQAPASSEAAARAPADEVQSAAPVNPKQSADLSQPPQASSSGGAAQPAAGIPAPTVQSAPAEAPPPVEPKVGFLAPDITLNALDGTSVRLSELRGKNVIINYWVTWCIPCKDELPALSRVSHDYKDQNLVILTINGIQQDEMDKVQQLVVDLGLTNPVLLDEGEAFWSIYMVQFLPTSFFIDSQGIIRHIMLGSTSEDALRAKVDQLISNQF